MNENNVYPVVAGVWSTVEFDLLRTSIGDHQSPRDPAVRHATTTTTSWTSPIAGAAVDEFMNRRS